MCFSGTDGNSEGRSEFLVGPTLLWVQAFLIAKKPCTDKSVGATELFPQNSWRRKFNDADFSVTFDLDGWRVQAEKFTAPPDSLGMFFGGAGKPILPEDRADLPGRRIWKWIFREQVEHIRIVC